MLALLRNLIAITSAFSQDMDYNPLRFLIVEYVYMYTHEYSDLN